MTPVCWKGNAYIDAFLADSDIFCINTRSTQGCSEDYLQCTAYDKTILTHAGCKSSQELVKRIFYLLFKPSVRFYSPLELRKGVALNSESLNTRHDLSSTGLAVVLQGLVRPRLRGTELEFWRNSAKRPAPIALLPTVAQPEWRMAPDAVFSPYASVRYFTPHMVHSQYNLLLMPHS